MVTGGASGIGEAIAKLFYEHGAKVVVADVQDELGNSVCKDLGGSSNSIFIHCDVTNEDHVQEAVDRTITTFGKLDIMICNAGISDETKPRIIDNTKADFERVLRFNVTGVFLSMKHAARVMVPMHSGCIISTSSVIGLENEELDKAMSATGNLKGATLRVDDVAKAAQFLASDDAQYISGHNLFIDGGFTVCNPGLGMFKHPEC
ncbi:Secoisolariciresinol dehydrogenase [Capsicum annuum]|uniref:Secoisolariciresinol dehydrogenase n=1 Tax=Capsicum annuum TaxID=4072 RepID=A0A2G2YN17_CAPAN|nr:Secoisolariciresinol dehydrogenase [Capsicum annuum]